MADRPTLLKLKARVPTISVGILTADLMRLEEELSELDGTGVEILHFDVMDGCFCPFMTVGPLFVRAVKAGDRLKDVHLMVSQPLEKVADYIAAGADLVTVHVEQHEHIHRTLQNLRSLAESAGRDVVRGVALNPGTPIEVLEPLIEEVDMVTVLGVSPGWGGQSLIPSTLRRVTRAKELIEKRGRDVLLCVDGGITKKNIAEVATWGADLVVTGSAVFDGKTPRENARFMLESFRLS
ncbi:MAG: ribulose-phosphate 3-epimerase [Acidobacteriota bacterium]|jgi:ribulose-phosphate 3-epimerase